jgi:hypothetical protein
VTVLVPAGANAFAKADTHATSGTAPTAAEGDQADEAADEPAAHSGARQQAGRKA